MAVTATALVFLLIPAGVFRVRESMKAARAGQVQAAEAVAGYHAAVTDLRTAAALLVCPADPAAREQGRSLGREVLGRYAVEEAGWTARPGFSRLAPDQQADLRAALGEVLILMTRAAVRNGDPASLDAADLWNRRTAETFRPSDAPAVVGRHRGEVEARRAGQSVTPFLVPEPHRAREQDLYFDGLDLAAAGRFAEALPLLARFCDRYPGRFLAWFARGACHDALDQHANAATAFAVCVALRPDAPLAHAHRGLARLRLGLYAEAEADFTRALELRPGWPAFHLHRAAAREGQGKAQEAQADYAAALEGLE
jgi:tetratricopeptide (TPR) repeat protein